jgi:hypothetical protein
LIQYRILTLNMSNSFSIIRHAIREMILSENYNVSITATPISTGEKRRRGQKAPEDKMANFILTPDDLDELISIGNTKDALQGYTEEDEEIGRRIGIIESRISQSAAKLARAILSQMSPEEIKENIYNLPAESGDPEAPAGEISIEHPEITQSVREYPVPRQFYSLALFEKPGARGTSIGKGEALAILMFGRDSEAGAEPDLTIGGNGFSVKYFENKSSTVFPGADLEKGDDIREIVEVSEEIKKIATLKGFADGSGRSISRNQIRNMLSRIDADISGKEKNQIYVSSGAARADLDPTGIADEDVNFARDVSEVRRLVDRCADLWDGLVLSGHDVIAIVGTKANMRIYSVPREMILPGLISKQGLQIASPAAAMVPVAPGAASAEEQAEEA